MTEYSEYLDYALKSVLGAGKITLQYYHKEVPVTFKDDKSPVTLADLESNQFISESIRSANIPVLSEESVTISWEIRKKWNKCWLIDPLDGTKEFIHKRDEFTINIALIESKTPVLGVVYAPVLNLLYYGMKSLGSYKVNLIPGMSVSSIKQNAIRINSGEPSQPLKLIASRSHFTDETSRFVVRLSDYTRIEQLSPRGSSLKLCMIAEGSADIYPRFGPTMEWDTAAGQAIVFNAGGTVLDTTTCQSLVYNKKDLKNPYFIVCNSGLVPLMQKLLNKA
jgi:3'(2'), 5'-bisphosphate nucleotidase